MKTLFTTEEIKFLQCRHCGKDLLNPPNGHLVLKYDSKDTRILDVRWVCRKCDDKRIYGGWAWKDISDLLIPESLVQWILGILEVLHSGREKLSTDAMEKIMQLLLIIFPHISKETTPKQEEELKKMYELPRSLGGLG